MTLVLHRAPTTSAVVMSRTVEKHKRATDFVAAGNVPRDHNKRAAGNLVSCQ